MEKRVHTRTTQCSQPDSDQKGKWQEKKESRHDSHFNNSQKPPRPTASSFLFFFHFLSFLFVSAFHLLKNSPSFAFLPKTFLSLNLPFLFTDAQLVAGFFLIEIQAFTFP
ncbi:hypothetical protein B0T13DRAFT_291238 [Neurospora crassa]|nr:hypothetical protein B0T13DRAFT_291238 [Neurospora crassa]